MGVETQIVEAVTDQVASRWSDKPISNKTGTWMTGGLMSTLLILAVGAVQFGTELNASVEGNTKAIEKVVVSLDEHEKSYDHIMLREDHTKIMLLQKDLENIKTQTEKTAEAQDEIIRMITATAKEIEADYNRRMDKLEKLLQENLAK